MNEQLEELAEEIDSFYAENNPYDRYDSVGSFSPEFDEDNEGLNQVKECLKSKAGRDHIMNYLNEVVNGEVEKATKEKGLMLMLKINEYNEYLKKQEIEQE